MFWNTSRILTLILLSAAFAGCSKKTEVQAEKPEPVPTVTTNSSTNTTRIDFPESSNTCDSLFRFIQMTEKAYVMDQRTNIEATLQGHIQRFAKEELIAKYGVDTGGVEQKPIKMGDCSVYIALAEKVKGNQKIMSLYDESESEFDPINYIFDHVLYYYLKAFDLVSGYEGRYTSGLSHLGRKWPKRGS